MFVRNLLTAVLRRAGRTYQIDPSLSWGDLTGEAFARGMQLIRGVARTRSLVFVGARVRLRGKRRIRFGRLSAIGDGSYLDGRTKHGVLIGAGAKIGRNCTISGTSHLGRAGEGFTLGKGSGIGDYVHVGCSGGVFLGDDVIVGPFVTFHSQEHNFDNVDVAIRNQGTKEAGITIESNVWIGAKATFLAGVTIGSGSVVAAGSVVRTSFPADSVIGGVPARLLRSRSRGSVHP